MDSTTQIPAAADDASGGVPVFGLPGNNFYVLHIAAIVSLSVSIVSSLSVLIYLFFFASKKSLAQRSIGERLVVYLALLDLFMSISHELDHSYMLAVLDNPPQHICIAFAFLLSQFTLGQSLVVLFTAVNAMVMVVFEKKIQLGHRDWKLIVVTLGVPLLVGIIGAGVPFLGPTGSWCFVDTGKWYGAIVSTVYAMGLTVVFIVNAVCYAAIIWRIRKASKSKVGASSSQTNKYHKTAKLMLLFVAVYLFQWWTFVVQALWSFAGVPSVDFYITSVVFINLGGVYNAVVYTVIRRKFSSGGDSKDGTSATQPSTVSSSLKK